MKTLSPRRRTLLTLVMGAALLAPACHGPYGRHQHHRGGGEVVADIVTTAAVTAAFVALWHGFCHCCHRVSYVVVHRY